MLPDHLDTFNLPEPYQDIPTSLSDRRHNRLGRRSCQMKGREFEKVARNEFLLYLPGYVARGSLIYEEPVGDIMKGIDADTSSFTADRLFVTAFVMPLYVPGENIVLSISRRLGGLGDGALQAMLNDANASIGWEKSFAMSHANSTYERWSGFINSEGAARRERA
jgi:hypothetical protein